MTLVRVPGRRHYNDTRSNYGKRGGTGPTAGKKATKFKCVGPDGTKLAKRVFINEPYEQPVSLWHNHAGTWHLNTVVDRAKLPDWSANYVMGEATLI